MALATDMSCSWLYKPWVGLVHLFLTPGQAEWSTHKGSSLQQCSSSCEEVGSAKQSLFACTQRNGRSFLTLPTRAGLTVSLQGQEHHSQLFKTAYCKFMEEGCLLVVFSFAQTSAWQTVRSNCSCNAGKRPEYMGQCVIYANGSRHCWMPACSAALEESLAVKTRGNLRSNSVRGLFSNYILWPTFCLIYIFASIMRLIRFFSSVSL